VEKIFSNQNCLDLPLAVPICNVAQRSMSPILKQARLEDPKSGVPPGDVRILIFKQCMHLHCMYCMLPPVQEWLVFENGWMGVIM
jgi:hypothetical protein